MGGNMENTKEQFDDPPIMTAIQDALEKHPRIMGAIMGIILHPVLTTIIFNR